MGNPYPATFLDQNAEGRLVGEVDFTDATNQPGGSSPANEQLNNGAGNLLSTGDQLTFARVVGSVLLDLTDPTVPVFVAAGVYLFSLSVSPDDNGAGTAIDIQLQIASALMTGGNQKRELIVPMGNATVFPTASLAHSATVLAGDSFYAKVFHDIGAPMTFYSALYLLKLA